MGLGRSFSGDERTAMVVLEGAQETGVLDLGADAPSAEAVPDAPGLGARNPPTGSPAPARADGGHRYAARGRMILGIVLCLANTFVSGLLLLHHHGEELARTAVGQACGESAESGCEVVAGSRYSEVAGMPLAAVGVFFYASLALLLLLAAMAGSTIAGAASGVGVLALGASLIVYAVLLGFQAIAIHAFCRVCLVTYVVAGLSLLALLPARGRHAAAAAAVRRTGGRLVLLSWTLLTALLAVAVAASETMLDYRQHARAVTMLGLGGPESALPPAAPGSLAERYQERARRAAERAARLQEILDDPKQLDQYFAEKARRQYDQAPIQALNTDGVPFRGPAHAQIRVVEYSDFLCPYCRELTNAFGHYLPRTEDRVTVFYKNYPLDQECNVNVTRTVHPGSCWLSLGAICATDQRRFWPYHDLVFSSPPTAPQAADVVRLATAAGVDPSTFQACLQAPATRDRLAAEISEAYGAGVRATPTLFINGKRLPRVNDFASTVSREVVRQGLPPLPTR